MNILQTSMVDKFRSALQARKAELQERILSYLHGSGDPDKLTLARHLNEVDEWKRADLFNESDMALLEQELTELNEIDAALRRIAGGSYGMCAECGQAIGIERLQAQPTAQTCLSCKHAFEKRRGFVHNGI